MRTAFGILFSALLIITIVLGGQREFLGASLMVDRSLRLGSKGEQVQELQRILKQEFPRLRLKVSGVFDRRTKKALKSFQKKQGLRTTGVVDQKTMGVLNSASGDRGSSPNDSVTPSVEHRGPPITRELPPPLPVTVPPVATASQPVFEYHWKSSGEFGGEVQLPTPVARPVVVLSGQSVTTIATDSATRLLNIYHLALVDDEVAWDSRSAGLLLNTLERFPKTPFGTPYGGVATSKRVVLTEGALTNDVAVNSGTVRISKQAFVFSNPILQPKSSDGTEKIFYSNRLFKAALRAFFNDADRLKEVIKTRYGFEIALGTPADEFQSFTAEELIFIASVLEDLPSGFRNLKGLQKIVRRKNGLTNPTYPSAPAIAWVTLGYIEFMDSAFASGSASYIERLIAHEMAHFLWHHVFADTTRQEFMALSGWTKQTNGQTVEAKGSATVVTDPASPRGRTPLAGSSAGQDHPKFQVGQASTEKWHRKTTTNFVSDYSAAMNPDEDFAETLSYYLYLPDKVRTHAPEKYDFVKNKVDGYEYVVMVDKQFTFQVFNLEPDRTFPGKIVGVDISVMRQENGDSKVTADLRLSEQNGGGAERAFTRIFSSLGTWVDLYFYPVNGSKYLLRGEFVLDRTSVSGYWTPEQITVSDRVDNQRYEGQSQFGWMMLIEHPAQDLEAPVAQIDGIRGEMTTVESDQAIRVTIPVTDTNMNGLGGYGTVQQYSAGQKVEAYATYRVDQKVIVLDFPIRKYHASGNWEFREFRVFDKARNERRYDLKERAISFDVRTSSPDSVKPVLDVASIRVTAVPTKPMKPDGQTSETIVYQASDDNSGLGVVTYRLLKPNGQTLFDYHYHDNFYSAYFLGDATAKKEYVIQLTLPPGSEPGTWALQELVLKDKAGNILTGNFVEIGILRPFEVK